ncbi:hypothetical protein [Komagataeibacter diospyri]|uniref:hypothetical protein n=1 Tax=Komagataeibacter diospyri TaxID=1932662 RepID=UPI003756942D
MKKVSSLISSSVLCALLAGCYGTVAKEGIKYRHLSKMSEEQIQAKTIVTNQPWSKTAIVSQEKLYDNGHNWDNFGDNKVLTVDLTSFLYSVIKKSDISINYYLGIDTDVGGVAYQHMEYTEDGVKKYTNVTNIDNETSCDGAHVYAGRVSPDCHYETNAAFPISKELLEKIASSDQPFKVLFVSENSTIVPFDDIIAPSEARALLDRVQQEAASVTPATKAQPDTPSK